MVQDTPVAYFNHAGKTWSPQSILDVGVQALDYEAHPWKEPPESLDQITQQVRQLFANLIGSHNCSDIALCPSAGFAFTMIAHNLARSFREHSKILILQDEFSSEIYPWQEVVGGGCSFHVIPYPIHNWEEAIIETIHRLQNELAVVCLPQVHWCDGSLVGIEAISQVCLKYSIPLVIDGTQSIGIMPFHIQRVPCDALVVSTHKWLLGPRGICLVYVHPKYHTTWLPLDQHERSRVAFQNEAWMDAIENSITSCGYPKDFIPGAARFDSGGRKNLVLLSMVQQGLKIVSNLDLDKAQMQLSTLTYSIQERVGDFGFTVRSGPRAGHILGLRHESWTTDTLMQVGQRLKDRNIYVAIRHGAIRISPYLNTSLEEVEQLIQGLKMVVHDMT